jgi:hypothetical protein
MADTLSDNGTVLGSYDVTIDGYSYTLETLDHDLPVTGEAVRAANGTFNGGSYVRDQEKLSVKIFAVTGTQAPSQLVRFTATLHGYAAKYWLVTNLKIASSTAGLRAYTADIVQAKSLTA